jgi:hypothetical protein
MENFKNEKKSIRPLLIIEIILLIIISFVMLWLKNIIIGFYYFVLIFTLISWLILFVLTINLYNKQDR